MGAELGANERHPSRGFSILSEGSSGLDRRHRKEPMNISTHPSTSPRAILVACRSLDKGITTTSGPVFLWILSETPTAGMRIVLAGRDGLEKFGVVVRHATADSCRIKVWCLAGSIACCGRVSETTVPVNLSCCSRGTHLVVN